MNVKDKIITPNYERMRESFCYALQTTWTDYVKAHNKYMESIWYNEKGELCMLYTEEAADKLEEAYNAFVKAKKDLRDFDEWVKIEKQYDIFRKKLMGEE